MMHDLAFRGIYMMRGCECCGDKHNVIRYVGCTKSKNNNKCIPLRKLRNRRTHERMLGCRWHLGIARRGHELAPHKRKFFTLSNSRTDANISEPKCRILERSEATARVKSGQIVRSVAWLKQRLHSGRRNRCISMKITTNTSRWCCGCGC